MGMKKIFNLLLKIVFLVSLVIFPFGQFLRIELPNFPEIKLQPLDFLCFIFVFISLAKKLVLKEKFKLPELAKIMAVFLGIALFSFLINVFTVPAFSLVSSFLYFLRLFEYFLFFWSVADFLKESYLPVSTYLIFAGLAVAVLALGQYFLVPDTRFIYNLGWDEHYFRAIGSFLDPAFTALLINLSFIIWLSRSFDRKVKNIYWWSLGLIFLVSIGLSFSRLNYGVLLLSAILIFIIRKKTKLITLIVILFISMIFFLPKPAGEGVNLLRTNSVFAKLENYQLAWKIIADHPVFGVGFNNYRITQRKYGFLSEENWQSTNAGAGADNSFLFTWATTGIFGFLTLLFLLARIMQKSILLAVKNEMALILFTSTIAIAVSSFFVNAFFYPWVLFWLMLLLAKFTAEN